MGSPSCWKYSGSSRFCCALVLNWCFRAWWAAVFKAHEHEPGCSRCFQSRIWEQASDCLNSFVDGGEETQKSRSTRLRLEQLIEPIFVHFVPLCTSACETYMIQFLFQINPKQFVWTARFKRDLCGGRAKLHDLIFTWSPKLQDRPRGTRRAQCRQPADERATAVQRLDTTHFYCPPVTVKQKSDDLMFASSRKLHDRPCATRRAHCRAASWWEGHCHF